MRICTPIALLLAVIPTAAPAVDTTGQAYVKAVNFLRAQGWPTSGWAGLEAQSVLLGEAIAGDPRAAGPRSTTLLASLALASVDARARRMSALAGHGVRVAAEVAPLTAARTPGLGFGASRDYLPTPLDTALALQALDAADSGSTTAASQAAADLASQQLASGMWPLVRGGTTGDFATTAQALLALAPREAAYPNAVGTGVASIWLLDPQRPSERALQVLALLAVHPALVSGASGALADLVALQNPNGSFGSGPQAELVYATALAARALLRSDVAFPFDSDNDGTVDELDPDDDDDFDDLCDPGVVDPSCSGSDAFPTDPNAQYDTDGDGIRDGVDADDDGDGVPDTEEPGYAAIAQESRDTDGDGLADTRDPDDDADGVPDVDELLAGLDPRRADTDGDSFRDDVELAAGTDARDPSSYRPDGDVFPLGAPDAVVDERDALLVLRVLQGLVAVPGSAQSVFLRHADVAPLLAGAPAPNGAFDAADALVLVRRVRGLVAPW